MRIVPVPSGGEVKAFERGEFEPLLRLTLSTNLTECVGLWMLTLLQPQRLAPTEPSR